MENNTNRFPTEGTPGAEARPTTLFAIVAGAAGFARVAAAILLLTSLVLGAVADPMTLVEDGNRAAPIVVAQDAASETLQAAQSLADTLAKISGAKPELLHGAPSPIPASAIWVGLQPAVTGLFQGVRLDFDQPEELVLVCRGGHLLIAGRDRAFGDAQIEFGTANAVYTFLQRNLDVRWLWPGPLGEDIVPRETIVLAPFEYRYAPPFRQRDIFHREAGALLEWSRFQRIYLDSFWVSAGHGFGDWWEKYHADHPEYFALQPDGTRSGHPSPRNAKLCQSNRGVWSQWLANVAVALEKDPTRETFQASPNDGSNSGICICERCLAWDHPDGSSWYLNWSGFAQAYVAMTDRYVTFWNHLARGLKSRFPDRELHVAGMAYGPGKPAPIEAALEDNIVIGYVGHFPLASDAVRAREQEEWTQWAEQAPKLVFRPNLFYYSGGHHALPTLVTRNTMQDFRFLAEHNGMGITVDGTPRHWATQGPQYYIMAQFAWDPMQDGEALLEDYYQRGFGPAASAVRRYFDLMEEAHLGILQSPAWRPSMGVIRDSLTELILAQFNDERLARAAAILDEARDRTVDAPDVYGQRVAFVQTGLEFTRLLTETMALMTRVRESGGTDVEAVEAAVERCRARDELLQRQDGIAINTYLFNRTWTQGRGLQDYVGPPSEQHLKAAGLRKVYRWTGRAAGNLWSLPGNWEVREGTDWVVAAASPGPRDFVLLGNETQADAPQHIALGRDTTVRRLTVAATGNRAYHIGSAEGAAEKAAEGDGAGRPPRLHLADNEPLVQEAAADADLHLNAETLLTAEGPCTVLLHSTNGARIVIADALRTDQHLTVEGGATLSTGILELRAAITTPRFFLSGEAHLLLNAASGTVIDRAFQGVAGTVLVQRDATLGSIYQFGGDVRFRLHAAGTNDLAVTTGQISRGGDIRLVAPEEGSTGRLVFRTTTIAADAGRVHAPTLHVAENTFVDLGGDQEPPSRADLAAGIHGAGGLIKSRVAGRQARKISIIGERNTYRGGTFIQDGVLQLTQVVIPSRAVVGGAPDVTFAGQLGPGPLHIESPGTFDLSGLTQRVRRLSGGGTVLLQGGTLVVDEPMEASFHGDIIGPGTLVEAGAERAVAP